MAVSSANQAKLNLLTATEVAETLKLNPQVVLRKLSSGEIPGYKLGKEWRVSEAQLLAYLESRSNAKARVGGASKVLRTYFKDGKLTQIPSTHKKRLAVLRYLVSQLQYDKVYSEKEINSFLKEYHSDVCTLRREFIMNGLMVRKDGKYKRVAMPD